jgi:hypothetical protein
LINSSIDPKKQERLGEWKLWLDGFKSTLDDTEKESLELIPSAAELLNSYYWRLAKQYISPLLQDVNSKEEHNIHYYKIISASELTVMAVLPWNNKVNYSIPHDKRCQVNARFGMFVAISIMLNWKIDGKEVVFEEELIQVMDYKEKIDVINSVDKYYPITFQDEHIDFLTFLNISGPLPVIANSQVWRLCHHSCTAIRNNGNL